jgi:hypothetical protein
MSFEFVMTQAVAFNKSLLFMELLDFPEGGTKTLIDKKRGEGPPR